MELPTKTIWDSDGSNGEPLLICPPPENHRGRPESPTAGYGATLKCKGIPRGKRARFAKPTPESVLRSLVADIEAMQRHPHDREYFGGFLDIIEDDRGYFVSWANLNVLLVQAQEVLK